jgi:hypothetical protein
MSSACSSDSVNVASYGSLLESLPSQALDFSLTPPSPAMDSGGVYVSDDLSLCAFVSSSPKTPTVTRPQTRTQVDLVLPPSAAFTKPGMTCITVTSQPRLIIHNQALPRSYGRQSLVSVVWAGIQCLRLYISPAICGTVGDRQSL